MHTHLCQQAHFKKKGIVLLIAFILLVILGGLSLTFIYIVQTNTSSVTNWFLQRQAQILSENGINLAIAYLLKTIQNNPFLTNESDILKTDTDIEYNDFFSNKSYKLTASSLSKYKQKFLKKEHEFALLTTDEKKFFGVKVFIKDASGKINAKNPNTLAFQHFVNNLFSKINITNTDLNFSLLYTEKFPHTLRKYFSLYPVTFNLLKYSAPDNRKYDEYNKFKEYFQKQFEYERRSFININTADKEVIEYNLSESEAKIIRDFSCMTDSVAKKNAVFFENAFEVLQVTNKPFCRINLKQNETKKIYISSSKAQFIAQYFVTRRAQIKGWKNYKELFAHIKSDLTGNLSNEEIELLLSLIHPKPLIGQLYNYKNIKKSIDKINITKGGFEFSFTSDGFFEIYAAGLIFTPDKLMAQEITFKLVKLFSKEIWLGYNDFKNKIAFTTNTDLYPYSSVNLPKNISDLDGFIALAKKYNFCNSEEGRIFKYIFSDDANLDKIGLFNLEKEQYIINPAELRSFIIKEGIYIPPNFSLMTTIEKTMDIKLLEKQEGERLFCSPFLSVRPYIYLLNYFGVNILFKALRKSPHLSFEFTAGRKITSFKTQILNTTLKEDKLQFWFIDYPLTIEVEEQNINPIDELRWHMFSYYYYFKINQSRKDTPTEEKFNIYTKIDNRSINTFPKENLYINTAFFEDLFQNQNTFLVGGNLFPLTHNSMIISGLCFYRMPNFFEWFDIPYQKYGSVQIINSPAGYKVIKNIYYFGEGITVNNLSETNTIKINFSLRNEDEFPILDIVEYLIFNTVQFLESY